ncbi:cathepsin F-like [Lineus longissimus]|uniref:cathepsin F-like n=1 Tax=Lineus longissimus TaxID=88925 RepID=UPI002B4C585C
MASQMAVLVLVGLSLFVGIFATGGWGNVPLHDPRLNELTNYAINKLNTKEGNVYWSKLVQIKSASKQVVNGLRWKITFSWKPTRCTLQISLQAPDPNACEFDSDAQESTCTVELYEAPYYHDQPNTPREPQVTRLQCNQPQQKAKVATYNTRVGGAHPISNLDDETVVTAAKKAVERINMATNSMYLKSLIRIQSATRQETSGSRIRLKLAMGTSTCRKQGSQLFATVEHCPLAVNSVPEICSVSVELWQNKYDIESFSCSPQEETRFKRSVDENVVQMEQPILGGDDGHDIHYGMFQSFKMKFNKIYASKEEELRRFRIFQENMIKARKIQSMEMGTARYGATKFSDLTEEEFRKNYLSPAWKADNTMKKAKTPNIVAPDAFDWRDHNVVTEVKNQGSCGSCWAFSTTGNIEGQWALKKKNLVSLSEQELVDCDKVDQGCNGGLPSQAYKEIIRLGGLEGETDYPYKGRNDKCAMERSKVKVYINDSVTISTDEAQMATWLAANGPISIGINANAMQFYFGGISHPWKIFCSPENLDHGVLIVGYGLKGSEPYWIVKNSWGPTWGEKGYYLVYRGAGVCGLNRMPTSAVVK